MQDYHTKPPCLTWHTAREQAEFKVDYWDNLYRIAWMDKIHPDGNDQAINWQQSESQSVPLKPIGASTRLAGKIL
jgi:hypothetical protein